MQQSAFINNFQKGSSENANIGNGVFVGVETYSKKGIAQLTKDTVKVSGSVVVDLPLFIAFQDSDTCYVQGDTGRVYKGTTVTTSFDTWQEISPSSLGAGHGLAFYEGYLFAFRGTSIDIYDPMSITPWTQGWKTGIFNGIACPFIFPNDNSLYFGNGNRVGRIGLGTSPTFNPFGTLVIDYSYDDSRLILPSFYQASSLSFLPINYMAIGTSSASNSQVADLILWNPTLSTYETPLRLYSQARKGENGIKQLINRNNVLYAVTGGDHNIYATNGVTFNQVANLSLYSNIRKTTGMQAQVPVFMNPKVSAIDIFGNKLLTGVSTPSDISYYPSGYGLFPCGIWSVAFQADGNSVQCEYTISDNTVVAVNKQFSVGFLKCIDSNQTLVGWQDGTSYGIDIVSTLNFQHDIDAVMIESEMMEIGTPLNPETISNIQLNTTRTLIDGQAVEFNYRTGFDQDFQPLYTFTSANNYDNGYKIPANAIGATRFLQLQVQMATVTYTETSPEIRNIIVAP